MFVLLQTGQDPGGIGVLGVLAVVVALFLVLNAMWKRDKQRKAARDKAVADRLLDKIWERPDDPINVARLARRAGLRQQVAQSIIDGKLLKEGYVHYKRRKQDRRERLFLSPSGREAMQRRASQKS